MTIPFKDIVLWGHSLKSYQRMFALTEKDLQGSILDCCGGPASFNAELTKQGGKVISIDKLFIYQGKELKGRIDNVFQKMLTLVEAHQQRFIWDEHIPSPQALSVIRQANIELFLEDFIQNSMQPPSEQRYFAVEPPHLPFTHFQFDLALCSHYFFGNCNDQSSDFHVRAMSKLCDVAREVRIFPLLDSQGNIPSILGAVTQGLHDHDLGVEIKAVPYKFQQKGNAMLRVWAQTCEV